MPNHLPSNKEILQIANKVSAAIGAEFLRSIVQHLASSLDAKLVYVGEFAGGQVERVRVLAASGDDEADRLDYPLAGSASAAAALGRRCLCRGRARRKFPEDSMLSRLGGESFVGVPLMNDSQQALGILMAVYDRPIRSFRVAESMLEFFAPRAAAEVSRKQSEETLRESAERYRTFIAANPDGMWRVEFESPIPTDIPEAEQVERIHQEGYIAECNDAVARFLGRTRAQELIGCRINDFKELHSDMSVKWATLAAVKAEYRMTTAETRPLDRLGRRRYVLRSQWGVVENGALQRVWGCTRDITELRKAELELIAAERRMSDLMSTVHLLVIVLDLKGSITFCSDYLAQLTGWENSSLTGMNWFDLMIPEEERELVRGAFESSQAEPADPEHLESTLLGPDGKHWWISWDLAALRDAEGKITGAVYVGRDATQQKELEAQFRQTQKLESIGRLASGLAHDFNNLLTVIGGYTGEMLAHSNQDHPAYFPLMEIKKSVEKGSDLTRQLLAFGRKQPFRPTDVNLNAVIVDDERMLRRLLGEEVEFTTNLDPALNTIRADVGHLRQILLNLVINARDAMPEGGRFSISTSNVDISDKELSVRPGLPRGRYVELVVTDTGEGMSDDVRNHLFEPFFTTKQPGRGSGLGLCTVYGIVKESAAYIFVESKPSQGAIFSVFFPRVEAVAALDESHLLTSPKGGNEHILLVEDQYPLRVLEATTLRKLGYRVTEAEGPLHALELARRKGARFDLLVADATMPEMRALELVSRIQSAFHMIKVLLMSSSGEAAAPGDQSTQDYPCIQKPFTPDSLGLKVREILDAD